MLPPSRLSAPLLGPPSPRGLSSHHQSHGPLPSFPGGLLLRPPYRYGLHAAQTSFLRPGPVATFRRVPGVFAFPVRREDSMDICPCICQDKCGQMYLLNIKKYRRHHEGIDGHARQGKTKPLTRRGGEKTMDNIKNVKMSEVLKVIQADLEFFKHKKGTDMLAHNIHVSFNLDEEGRISQEKTGIEVLVILNNYQSM